MLNKQFHVDSQNDLRIPKENFCENYIDLFKYQLSNPFESLSKTQSKITNTNRNRQKT